MKQQNDVPPLEAALGSGVALRIGIEAPPARIASPWQRIEIARSEAFGPLYVLDGDPMVSLADDALLHEMLIHPAALAHPAPRRALVLGGGDGASARELLKHPSIERIVVAELDPAVVETVCAQLPQLSAGAFDDARVSLRIGDAALTVQALLAAGERFDLIVFDLTEPDDPSAAPLHRESFFACCAALLTERGKAVVQLGSPFYRPERVGALYRRVSAGFRSCVPLLLSVPLYGGPWLIAHGGGGADDPGAPSENELAARLAARGIPALRVYNPALHRAALALPNEFRDLLRHAAAR